MLAVSWWGVGETLASSVDACSNHVTFGSFKVHFRHTSQSFHNAFVKCYIMFTCLRKIVGAKGT